MSLACVSACSSKSRERPDEAPDAAGDESVGDDEDEEDAEVEPDDVLDASTQDAARADAMVGMRDGSSAGQDASVGDAAVDARPGTKEYVQLNAAGRNTCAVDAEHAVRCWGIIDMQGGRPTLRITYGSDAIFRDWERIRIHESGRCGQRGGKIFCWGQSSLDGTKPADYNVTPVRIGTFEQVYDFANDGMGACAILSDHSLYCWGDNSFGQLGNGVSCQSCSTPPTRVGTANDWQFVAMGFGLSCGIRSGKLFCWGEVGRFNWMGAVDAVETCPLGMCQRTPQTVFTDLTDLVEVGMGTDHVCVRRQNGEVHCRGYAVVGQLGNPEDAGPGPVAQGKLMFSQLSVGREHNCGISGTGLYCWGNNAKGQLGDGVKLHTTCDWFHDCSSAPVEVIHPQRKGWRVVAAGDNHTCALDSDGLAFCWGENDYRELGIGKNDVGPDDCGSAACAFAPVQVSDPLACEKAQSGTGCL